MKLGIIGLKGSGKKTVFEVLTGQIAGPEHSGEDRIGTIRVPDHRLDTLSAMYQTQKTTYAQVEYLLPGARRISKDKGKQTPPGMPVRDCDALIHVVRNFGGYGLEKPEPGAHFAALDQELILSDLMVVEKRIERLSLDRKRGDKTVEEERSLLERCLSVLESETALRKHPELVSSPLLRGYGLMSAKLMLVLINNEDDNDRLPESEQLPSGEDCLVIRGKLEHELAQMTRDEAKAFLSEFNIPASATDRVVKRSYELLGLVTFFTVGGKEVRASTVKSGTRSVDAAGVVHSDMKRGFIRAEVIPFDDLMDAGSYREAKKKGIVRLEGKAYEVRDGDIIHFRFNV
jgi:ribosome-binding ATPase YchF (GTP1/OBG family)